MTDKLSTGEPGTRFPGGSTVNQEGVIQHLTRVLHGVILSK
jgi:hypothetical protein